MANVRQNRVGIVLKVKEISDLDKKLPWVRVFREDTNSKTFETWINSGKIVLMSETMVIDNTRMPSLDGFEAYDSISIEQARELIPKTGFGELTWTAPYNSDIEIYLTGVGFDWFLDWNNCLPTSDSSIAFVPSPTPYECRKWTVRSVTNNHTITYEANVLIDPALGNKIGSRNGVKFSLLPTGWQTPWGEYPLTFEERKQAGIALSISSRPSTLYKLTFTQMTNLYISSGPSGYKSEAYVDLCRREMDKCQKEGVCKVALIAGKGEGKSTFIELLKETSAGKNLFIEDSDDWGQWIAFLVHKTGKLMPQDLEKVLTDATAIQYVAEFYDFKAKGGIIPSYFNSCAERVIELKVKEAKYDLEHLTPTQLHNLLTECKPPVHTLLLNANSAKHINQKTFEDGIRVYNIPKMKDYLYICFMHIAQDNVKRMPADIIVRFDTGTDSIVNQALRASNKNYTSIQYLADLLLKIIYTDATEFVMPKLTAGEVLRMFGIVPVLDGQFKLKLYRDIE